MKLILASAPSVSDSNRSLLSADSNTRIYSSSQKLPEPRLWSAIPVASHQYFLYVMQNGPELSVHLAQARATTSIRSWPIGKGPALRQPELVDDGKYFFSIIPEETGLAVTANKIGFFASLFGPKPELTSISITESAGVKTLHVLADRKIAGENKNFSQRLKHDLY